MKSMPVCESKRATQYRGQSVLGWPLQTLGKGCHVIRDLIIFHANELDGAIHDTL
jgi:hypothetical protein